MRLSRTEIYLLAPVLLGTALAAWAAYRLGGFLAIGLLGLLTGFIAVRMDLEKEGAIGSAFSGSLHAQQVMARETMSRSERASHHAEMRSTVRALLIAKIIGAILVVLGFGALFYFG